MDDLVNDESVLEASVHMIAAMVDTDLRLGICAGGKSIVEKWPTPMLQCYVPVEYYPLNQGEMQMHQLSNEEFVVLLAITLVWGKRVCHGLDCEQNGCVFNINPLSAVADALHWYTKAYTKADEYGNDFISSVARVEAAYCIQRCGEGAIVAIPDKVVLRRDFRTEFGGKGKNEEGRVGFHSLCHTDQHHLQIAVDREWERFESGKSPTELTSEEKHVICWKKSLTSWNEAMKYYDYMADIGMGQFIHAETSAWRNVLSHINYMVNKLKLSLECPFISPIIRIGRSKRRDMGTPFCENCSNYDGTKKCSRCKKVFYCSRDCQKAHWAEHKLTCCKKKM